MPKKKDRKPQGNGEKKLREMRKTNQQLKAQVRQLRKMLTLSEERIIYLEEALGDAAAVVAARKISRGKKKGLTECSDCGINAVARHVTDLGARLMIVTACDNCGAHFGRKFEKKEIE